MIARALPYAALRLRLLDTPFVADAIADYVVERVAAMLDGAAGCYGDIDTRYATLADAAADDYAMALLISLMPRYDICFLRCCCCC